MDEELPDRRMNRKFKLTVLYILVHNLIEKYPWIAKFDVDGGIVGALVDKHHELIDKITRKYNTHELIEHVEEIEKILMMFCEYDERLIIECSPSIIRSEVLTECSIYNGFQMEDTWDDGDDPYPIMTILREKGILRPPNQILFDNIPEDVSNLRKDDIESVRNDRISYLGFDHIEDNTNEHILGHAFVLLSCTYCLFGKMISTLYTDQEYYGTTPFQRFATHLYNMHKLYEKVKWEDRPAHIQTMFACKNQIFEYL